ncbi:MAG: IS110 family transposase [Lentisphaeria bacterium]|nr:IS110 family transposase [Lentisphaeria bacterium]
MASHIVNLQPKREKSSMSGGKNKIWIGFDVGKKSFSAAVDQLKDNGKDKVTSLPCRNFKRTPEGMEQFFDWVKNHLDDQELHIVMETTGCYSQHVADWIKLKHPEISITIENARKIHAYIESLNLPHKTDKTDAQAIARFGTERQPEPTNRPSPTIMVLRELSRERTALIKARVDLQNRRDSITSPVVRKINAQTLAALTMQIENIEKEIKACVVADEELLTEVHIMTTMPGVSFISAYSILAEIGSLKQYSAKELSAISGLAPRIKQSGSSVDHSFMSRRSSGRLRQILYLDSIPGLPKIPFLQDFYQRLIAKGKTKMTVRCACMRKMLLMLRSMVVHNTPFDENFLKNHQKTLDF